MSRGAKGAQVGLWVLQRAYVTASVRMHTIRFICATFTHLCYAYLSFVTRSLPSQIPLTSTDGCIGAGKNLWTLQNAANTNQVRMLR